MIFAMAVNAGLGLMGTALGGDSAETVAAYNREYQTYARKTAALDARTTAEKNISAINQDKILSSVAIQTNQAEARADALVGAATAGVSGGSVESVRYGIDANASLQVQAMEAQADQMTEQQLAIVNSSTKESLSGVEYETPTVLDRLGTKASQLTVTELDDMGDELTEWWSN